MSTRARCRSCYAECGPGDDLCPGCRQGEEIMARPGGPAPEVLEAREELPPYTDVELDRERDRREERAWRESEDQQER
jgi:hypothetical protein